MSDIYNNLDRRDLYQTRPDEREVYRDFLQKLDTELFNTQIDLLISGLLVNARILASILVLVILFRWWLS